MQSFADIRPGDRRFKRVQKEKSEIELETQLAIQQEKEQERLMDEEKRKAEEAENEKKAEEEKRKRVEDEERKTVEDDEKRKIEEAEKKAAEEQSKAAEETQPNAVENLERQAENVTQPTQEQVQHTPQQPQEPQVRTEQSNTSQPHLLQEQPPQQQEDKKPENPEVPVPQYQIEQQPPEHGGQLAMPQQDRVSVPATEAQQQQVVKPTQELSSQQKAFDSTESSQPPQPMQLPAAPAESKTVHASTPAPVPADQAPQETQNVPMEVDTQQTVETQSEPDVKTFSVAEASSQSQASQTFAVNKNPSFEPAQMSALSAQQTPQPTPEAPQIMFVNHHTTENQSGPVDVSQAQSQSDASAMQMPQAQDGTFVKQEEGALQSTQQSFSMASEPNSKDRLTSQLPHSMDNSQSQTTQNEGV